MPKIPKDLMNTAYEEFVKNQRAAIIGDKLKALGVETSREQPLPHLMIKAYAGSGKTSTLVEGLRLLVEGETTFRPSPQQEAIWEELLKSQDYAKTFCMTSFGNEIVKTLEERIPKHPSCQAKTLHAIGFKAINDSYGKRFEPDPYKSGKILASLKRIAYEQFRYSHTEFMEAVSELISYCKLNAFDPTLTDKQLEWIVEQYNLDIELDLETKLAVGAVLQQSCRAVEMIDYDDMIWLPVVNNLLLPSFDILFVDECQDLNVCQQRLALKLGKRLVLCGDPHQAVYAFAGADANSYNNLHKSLQDSPLGCIDLPLSVSFRCSQRVIKEAQGWVSGIEPYAKNPQGAVESQPYAALDQVRGGDLVICRNNAALVSQCLKFLTAGKKAYIRGRKNIAKGLVRLVTKIARECKCGESIHRFQVGLHTWHIEETNKAKFQVPPDERQIQYINDRADCLDAISKGVATVSLLKDKVYAIFEDKTKEGIQLSTIHQAKGIEARRVFFIMTKGNECPALWAKTKTQKEQDGNLRYIGITRAIEELIYIYN